MTATARIRVRWAMRTVLFVCGVCLAVACTYRPDEHILYEEVPCGRWQKSDALDFEILVPDFTRPYSLEVLLRHDNRYEYRDLQLSYSISTRGLIVFSDSVALTLADKPQQWNSSGIAMQQSCFRLPIPAHFPLSGLYKVELRHNMRVPSLSGITEAGIRLTDGRDDTPLTILPHRK